MWEYAAIFVLLPVTDKCAADMIKVFHTVQSEI